MKHVIKPHGKILEQKFNRSPQQLLLNEILKQYEKYIDNIENLNSENENELKEKVKFLNDYKNFIDGITQKNFKLQDKIGSSVIEEFLYFLFKDIPEIKTNLDDELIFLGQASAYMDLSFAPKNFKDFIINAGIYVNKKNQDFTISKLVKCKFINNGKEEFTEFVVPTVSVECKTFIPSTMLGQSDYEAQKIKQGNPYSLYVLVAEQNALSDKVLLKNSKIDEIFVLRKQKRRGNTFNKIYPEVVLNLYREVKKHLGMNWIDTEKNIINNGLVK